MRRVAKSFTGLKTEQLFSTIFIKDIPAQEHMQTAGF